MKLQNKTVFIGDLHGDIEFLQFVRSEYKDWNKIFLGDIVDSFIYSRLEQLQCLNTLFEMIERNENTTVLYGNHEWSYLSPQMRCSGYEAYFHLNQLGPLTETMMKHFKMYLWFDEDKILVSHAGLSQYWWKQYGLDVELLDEFLQKEAAKPVYSSLFGRIGHARGGEDRCGGLLWCDFEQEFDFIPEIKQVMGHTPGKFMREQAGNWAIDVSERLPYKQLLIFEDDKFKVETFNEESDGQRIRG